MEEQNPITLPEEMPEVSTSAGELPDAETPEEVTVISSVDYSPQLAAIMDRQSEQITLMQQQNEILLEQVNGLSLVVNYQNTLLSVLIFASVVFIAYRVLFKWFFRGV